MKNTIPQAVIAVISEVVSNAETHATLDGLFMYAGAPGDPPPGSKHAKALAWLRRINSDATVENPLAVLGKIVETYIESEVDPLAWNATHLVRFKEQVLNVFKAQGLEYVKGGHVAIKGVATPSRSLEGIIKQRDYASIDIEYDRALLTVESSPRDAVSAACNILEAVCKVYIEETGLIMPAKQELRSVWMVVRKDLGIDPSQIEDRDIQEILSGLFAIVGGIGALRTHASTAHGSGKRLYKLEPRHARLAVHGAHTVTMFILETWAKRASGAVPTN